MSDGTASEEWRSMPPPAYPQPVYHQPGLRPPTQRQPPQQRTGWRRILAPFAAVGAFLAKFGAILLKFKSLTLVGSMLVSVAAYSWIYGWKFAAGFVLLILIHECGHVVVLRARGIKAGLPVFVPFLGAFVSMKEAPKSAYDEALSGIAGPIAGTVAALAVWEWGRGTHSEFLIALAYTGFFLNLFNLLPVLPLDGGRAAAALHPALWLVGLIALLGWEIKHPSPIIPIILLIGGFELWRRWKLRDTPAGQAYFQLLPQQRWLVAGLYVGLVCVLVLSMHATYVQRSF